MPAPICPPPEAVPVQDSFGFHNEHRHSPADEPPTRQNPETPVRILEAWSWLAALQNPNLLPETKIIWEQPPLWADSSSNCPQQTAKHSPLPCCQTSRRLLLFNVVNE